MCRYYLIFKKKLVSLTTEDKNSFFACNSLFSFNALPHFPVEPLPSLKVEQLARLHLDLHCSDDS